MLKQGVLKVQFLDSYFPLKYMNDLSKNLVSNPKLCADDTSLFSAIFYMDLPAKNLNDNLNKISNSAFQWIMSFNPDSNKLAQEILFSRKIQKSSQHSLIFSNNIMT